MPVRNPKTTRQQLNILKIRARRDIRNAIETALALGIKATDILSLVREVAVVLPATHVPGGDTIDGEEAQS